MQSLGIFGFTKKYSRNTANVFLFKVPLLREFKTIKLRIQKT